MDLTIKSPLNGGDTEVVRDGSVIIDFSSYIWFEIEGFRFRFRFEDYKKDEKLINASNVEGMPDCMEITIRVNDSNLDSIFLAPAEIASVKKDDGRIVSLFLSFAAVKLSGSNNTCVQFNYTFFRTLCQTQN